jgi:hypothetical protein
MPARAVAGGVSGMMATDGRRAEVALLVRLAGFPDAIPSGDHTIAEYQPQRLHFA